MERRDRILVEDRTRKVWRQPSDATLQTTIARSGEWFNAVDMPSENIAHFIRIVDLLDYVRRDHDPLRKVFSSTLPAGGASIDALREELKEVRRELKDLHTRVDSQSAIVNGCLS